MTTEEYEKIKGMIVDLKRRTYNLGKAMACEDTTTAEKKKRHKRTFDATNNLLDYIASFVEVENDEQEQV